MSLTKADEVRRAAAALVLALLDDDEAAALALLHRDDDPCFAARVAVYLAQRYVDALRLEDEDGVAVERLRGELLVLAAQDTGGGSG